MIILKGCGGRINCFCSTHARNNVNITYLFSKIAFRIFLIVHNNVVFGCLDVMRILINCEIKEHIIVLTVPILLY